MVTYAVNACSYSRYYSFLLLFPFCWSFFFFPGWRCIIWHSIAVKHKILVALISMAWLQYPKDPKIHNGSNTIEVSVHIKGKCGCTWLVGNVLPPGISENPIFHLRFLHLLDLFYTQQAERESVEVAHLGFLKVMAKRWHTSPLTTYYWWELISWEASLAVWPGRREPEVWWRADIYDHI